MAKSDQTQFILWVTRIWCDLSLHISCLLWMLKYLPIEILLYLRKWWFSKFRGGTSYNIVYSFELFINVPYTKSTRIISIHFLNYYKMNSPETTTGNKYFLLTLKNSFLVFQFSKSIIVLHIKVTRGETGCGVHGNYLYYLCHISQICFIDLISVLNTIM